MMEATCLLCRLDDSDFLDAQKAFKKNLKRLPVYVPVKSNDFKRRR